MLQRRWRSAPLKLVVLLTGSGVLLTLGCGGTPKVDLVVQEMADAPIADRSGSSAVWTGTEVIFWGGRTHHGDGAAYDPSTGAWRTIAPAPLGARSRHGAAWSGSEMVVWGGKGHGGDSFIDGAAYDPTTDTWRLLPEPDPDVFGPRLRPFMTSSPALVVGDRFFFPAIRSVVSLDLVTGEWKRIEVELPGFPDVSYFSSRLTVDDGKLYLTARSNGSLSTQAGDLVIARLDPATAEVLDVEILADVGPGVSLMSTDHGLTLLVERDDGLSVLTNQTTGWEQVALHDMDSFGMSPRATPSRVIETGAWLVGIDGGRLSLIDRVTLEPAAAPIDFEVECAIGESVVWTGTYLVGWNSESCSVSENNRTISVTGGVVVSLPEPDR